MIKKIMTLLLILLVLSGCTRLKFSNSNSNSNVSERQLSSCEEEAEPKSLQFLEQQYRCTSK